VAPSFWSSNQNFVCVSRDLRIIRKVIECKIIVIDLISLHFVSSSIYENAVGLRHLSFTECVSEFLQFKYIGLLADVHENSAL